MSAPNATAPDGYTGLMTKTGKADIDVTVVWWNDRLRTGTRNLPIYLRHLETLISVPSTWGYTGRMRAGR